MSDCILFINDSMIPPIFSPFEYDSNNPCHRRIFCPGPSMLVIKLLQETQCIPAQNPKALASSRPAPRKRPTLQSSRSTSTAPHRPPAFMPALPSGLLQRLLTKRKLKNTQPDALPAPSNPELLMAEEERIQNPAEFMETFPDALPEPRNLEPLTKERKSEQNPIEFDSPEILPEPRNLEPLTEERKSEQSPIELVSPEILPAEAVTPTAPPETSVQLENSPERLQYPSPEAEKELPLQASVRRAPTGISIQDGLRRGNKIDLYYGNEYVGSGMFLYLGSDYLIWTEGEAIQVQVLDDPITIVKK